MGKTTVTQRALTREEKKAQLAAEKEKRRAEIAQFVAQNAKSQEIKPETLKNFVKVPVTNIDLLQTIAEYDKNGFTPLIYIPIPMGACNYIIFKKNS